MRWRLAARCALLVAAATACEASPTKENAVPAPTTTTSVSADEIAKLRTEVLAQVKPTFGHAEYAVTDPAIVDPCISDRLRGLGDKLPSASDRAAFVAGTAICVENALRTPAGLKAIGLEVAARYAAPVITRDGDTVTIDAGVLAGNFHVFKGVIEVYDTPLMEAGQWATPEVLRSFKLGMAKVPDAKRYIAKIEIPRQSSPSEWQYSYDREEDRVRVIGRSQPGLVYVSEKLGGDPANARSLLMTALRQEKLEKSPPWR